MAWSSSHRDERFNPDWPRVRAMILERDGHRCQWPVKDDYGNVITRNIKEKRTVTYNFSLAKKKLMEINRMIEKAKAHRACQAKKEEYG